MPIAIHESVTGFSKETISVKQSMVEMGMNSNPPATIKLYEPVLAKQDKISKATTVLRDVVYGDHERHVLDVYIPSTPMPEHGYPAVIYFHGGGFLGGSKNWLPGCYENVGCYFASQGIACIIPTHRLVPHGVTFPGGSSDVELVFQKLVASVDWNIDIEKVVPIGHTSGGTFMAERLYSGEELPKGMKIIGSAHLSTLFTPIASPQARKDVLAKYYGEDLEVNSPLEMYKRLPVEHPMKSLPVLLTLPEYECEEFVKANFEFMAAYREANNGALPGLSTLRGHNHISHVLAIGSDDEEGGKTLVNFVKSLL